MPLLTRLSIKLPQIHPQIKRNLASCDTTQSLRSHSKQTVILSKESNVKPYNEIPTKKSLLPPSLRLILSGGPAYLHEHCDRLHQELGPIYKDKLGSTEIVFLADTKLIQIVMANEGQYPHHNVPPAWALYNKIHNIQRGLFFQTGESWVKLRRAFNKVLLGDPQNIYQFGQKVSQINSDLLKSWIETGKADDSKIVIKDVKFGLCKWSIEATCYMLFGIRLGCVSDSSSNVTEPRIQELVMNVANMFSETSHFQILPVTLAHRLGLPVWNRFESATSTMLKIANDLARENISKAREAPERSLVKDLLSLRALTDAEVSDSVVDLIIAAADTTSNSLQWMLYLLARHKDVQARVSEEVQSLPIDADNPDKIRDKTPYLRAFIKEALRLYPTAPFLARTLDRDITLSNYAIPAGTLLVFCLYTTSRMEKYFKQPLKFQPERWLRATGEGWKRDNHAYASLPFGVGARMCIGRRAADFEMYSFIISLIREFECSLAEPDDVNVKLQMILCPDKPINLQLKLRSKAHT